MGHHESRRFLMTKADIQHPRLEFSAGTARRLARGEGELLSYREGTR